MIRMIDLEKDIKKMKKRSCLRLFIVAIAVCTIAKTVERHTKEIADLKKQFEGMKMKGV